MYSSWYVIFDTTPITVRRAPGETREGEKRRGEEQSGNIKAATRLISNLPFWCAGSTDRT